MYRWCAFLFAMVGWAQSPRGLDVALKKTECQWVALGDDER
jgi:hypothetical protein